MTRKKKKMAKERIGDNGGQELDVYFEGAPFIHYVCEKHVCLRNDDFFVVGIVPINSTQIHADGNKVMAVDEDDPALGYLVLYRPYDYTEGGSPWEGEHHPTLEEALDYAGDILSMSPEELYENMFNAGGDEDTISEVFVREHMYEVKRVVNDMLPSIGSISLN